MKYLLLLFLLSGCGIFTDAGKAKRHMRKAYRHIERAKSFGATIGSDTTFTNLRFNIKGPSTTLNLKPMIFVTRDSQRMLIVKDTVIFKDRIRLEFKDSLIRVDCPDSLINQKTPTAVNNSWQPPPAADHKLLMIGLFLAIIISFAAGVFAGSR